MPNGRLGDHPLTDLLVHGMHPFPLDMEEMILRIHELSPSTLRELRLEPFDWERGKNLRRGRCWLRRKLAELEAERSLSSESRKHVTSVTSRVVVFVLLTIVCGSILVVALLLLWSRNTAIDELLQFDASIVATYGSYQYTPRLIVNIVNISGGSVGENSSLQLVLDIGQRVHGFTVQGNPSRFVEWYVAIFGDRARRAFCKVVDVAIFDQDFGDDDVSLLLKFDRLHELDLSTTQITDHGVTQLRNLDRLTVLDLSYTRVTDEGIRQLSALDNLRELDVDGTNVSRRAIEEFEKRHPGCTVYH